MKKLILILLISFSGFAQNFTILTKEGFEPLVVDVENKSAEEIYLKAKDWIQTYYKNPNEVLKADISNQMLKIEGYAVNGFQTKAFGIVGNMDYNYTIELEFKENKYRLTYIIHNFYSKGQMALYTYKSFIKSDGTIRKQHEFSYDTLLKNVNETSNSLFNFINSTSNIKKNDW